MVWERLLRHHRVACVMTHLWCGTTRRLVMVVASVKAGAA